MYKYVCRKSEQTLHTTINNYHWFTDPKFCMQCIGIFQRYDHSRPVSPKMHYVVLTVASSGCLKLSQSVRNSLGIIHISIGIACFYVPLSLLKLESIPHNCESNTDSQASSQHYKVAHSHN